MPPKPSNHAQFPAYDPENEVICPISQADGSGCRKRCLGEKRYRSMQEHIRRAHPEYYLPKLPATRESFDLMINTPPHPVEPPPPKPEKLPPNEWSPPIDGNQDKHYIIPKKKNKTDSSTYSYNQPHDSFDLQNSYGKRINNNGYYNNDEYETTTSQHHLRRTSLLPAAAALTRMGNYSRQDESEWSPENEAMFQMDHDIVVVPGDIKNNNNNAGQEIYLSTHHDLSRDNNSNKNNNSTITDSKINLNNKNSNNPNQNRPFSDPTLTVEQQYLDREYRNDPGRGQVTMSIENSPPETSILGQLPRSLSRSGRRERKSSVSQNGRRPRHERKSSKDLLRPSSRDRKGGSIEPPSTASFFGKRWEDLIEAATSATEEEARELTLIPASPFQSPATKQASSSALTVPPPAPFAIGAQFQSFIASPLQRALSPPDSSSILPPPDLTTPLPIDIDEEIINDGDEMEAFPTFPIPISSPGNSTVVGLLSPDKSAPENELKDKVQIYCASCKQLTLLDDSFACTECICGLCAPCVEGIHDAASLRNEKLDQRKEEDDMIVEKSDLIKKEEEKGMTRGTCPRCKKDEVEFRRFQLDFRP